MTRVFVVAAAMLLALPAWAFEPYLTPDRVDLITLLPPPPPEVAPDLAQVLAAEQARTPERAAQAVADAEETVFDMFRPVLGERFTPAAAPLATTLFERLGETEEALTDPAKKAFGRPRPFRASTDVHPVVPLSKSFSYPSGHATRATMEGIVLAAMLPELRRPLFARMVEYRQSRVIGGVHYPSDLVAGDEAGTAAAAVLFTDAAFRADYAAARKQLRAALGIPN